MCPGINVKLVFPFLAIFEQTFALSIKIETLSWNPSLKNMEIEFFKTIINDNKRLNKISKIFVTLPV